MERVRLYGAGGQARRTGKGMYASLFLSRFPLIPVEEEGRLRDPRIRENFVERIFAFHRWQALAAARPRVRDLVAFHARHKLTLASHSDRHYRELGRLVAGAGRRALRHTLDEYARLLMEALKVGATPKKHANVLYHVLGFLKRDIDAADRAELADTIERYRVGQVPRVVPLTLLLHHLRRHPIPWLLEQTYLHPYPAELMLRNQI
jgi:uncharacterized protein YbgA (DUF1722 family)